MKKIAHTLSFLAFLPYISTFLRSRNTPTRQVEHAPPTPGVRSSNTAPCWIFTEQFSGATITIDRSTSQCLQWRSPADTVASD